MVSHPVIKTKQGVEIYVNLISSPAAPKIAKQPRLLALAKEALEPAVLEGVSPTLDQDMGRVIGTTDVVKTTDADTILYAKRSKSEAFTRFVKNRKMVETTYLSIELRQDSKNLYQIWDLRIGNKAPDTPIDENSTKKSKTFWSNHAVVWENGLTQAHTTTKDCPWEATIS